MRIAYFDCFSGVCGSMIIGALLDAGADLAWLETELGKLGLSGYRLNAVKTQKSGITGTLFSVETEEKHVHRSAKELLQIIDESALDEDVKKSSKAILTLVAETEAKIHDRPIDKIHMHEVAGIDSIMDVVGSVLCLRKLEIETVYSSPIHVGQGFIECGHGTLPVPAPATVRLLEGIPVYSRGIEAELATPTGVAILRTLSKSFGPFPSMWVEKSGYGAGERDLEIPNLLRVTIGESRENPLQSDEVALIETNLDDMNPELFGHVADLLWERGALDVYMTPIYMKKNRPGTMLSIMAPMDRLEEIISTLITETTTLGMRINRVERKKLVREIIQVETRFGKVQVKVSRIGDQIANLAPEYEDCKRIATERHIPLKDVYDEVKEAARKLL